jgi:hypothetical protein
VSLPGIVLAALLIGCSPLVAEAQSRAPGAVPSRCAPDMLPFSSPYCSELVAVPDLRGARGMMELT